MKNKWEIVYVPGKPPIPPDQQPTVNAYASVIDPKLANTLVRRLNQLAPLDNLRHVKRVRKKCTEQGKTQLSVILCLAGDDDEKLDSIPSNVSELINSHQLSAFITKVCKYAASSKEEWEEQCKLWPTSYHPPTYNIDGITGFSEEDSELVFSYMKFAVGLSKSGDGQAVNAAVIVDPSAKQVIASACDHVCSCCSSTKSTGAETGYSFKHAEAFISYPVANGAPRCKTSISNGSPNEPKHLYTSVSCLYPWRWAEQQLHKMSSCHWHPLQHAAIVAIEKSAARDRHLFPGVEQVGDRLIQVDHLQSSSTHTLAKRQKIDLTKVEDDPKLDAYSNGFHYESARPYLCTGYDIYLVWEPCIMCAMALVHQRIRRVFYAFENPNTGALGSVHRLQGEKSLNHHYAVFRVVVPGEVLNKYESESSAGTDA
ncbi:tRNA-specific adenosine deaminase TAD3 [Malania oleifera]|uniref:tRNA-specific adenosine deaminase TAD3 n=1 Tax=Malania oleifera TaxID=397392 RepID=UPI0025AE3AA7|nr:tRNA-specific adenosine deaminase TAD3 [Malania oleifera]